MSASVMMFDQLGEPVSRWDGVCKRGGGGACGRESGLLRRQSDERCCASPAGRLAGRPRARRGACASLRVCAHTYHEIETVFCTLALRPGPRGAVCAWRLLVHAGALNSAWRLWPAQCPRRQPPAERACPGAIAPPTRLNSSIWVEISTLRHAMAPGLPSVWLSRLGRPPTRARGNHNPPSPLPQALPCARRRAFSRPPPPPPHSCSP